MAKKLVQKIFFLQFSLLCLWTQDPCIGYMNSIEFILDAHQVKNLRNHQKYKRLHFLMMQTWQSSWISGFVR